MTYDVLIAGGGPAGLALAIHTAGRGLRTLVCERQAYPIDKACGEGLMPSGARQLERLGVRALLSPIDAAPFRGIRYVQEDGSSAVGHFAPGAGGLGIRRTALSQAMVTRARECGARVLEECAVEAHAVKPPHVEVRTTAETFRARMLVAADGLMSPLRTATALEAPSPLPRRFGIRRHFRIPPWSDLVEVHFAGGVEAYVTPVGAERVGVAFLWTPGDEKVSFEVLLERFPALAKRLAGAESDSTVRGAGPLAHDVRTRVGDRFALLGDAAGYVDALTGEGLSLAFSCADALAKRLPVALAHGATAASLAGYERDVRRIYRPYIALTRGMLGIARRRWLRRMVVGALGAFPSTFDRILRQVA